MKRYPFGLNHIRYNKIVGTRRVTNIEHILVRLGFTVTVKEPEDEDVDVWAVNSGEQNLVIEVTNWRKSSYMSDKKAESVKKNFRKYTCNKLFLCSFKENYQNRLDCIEEDVDVLELNFQTQPEAFFDFYNERNESDSMKRYSIELLNIVEKALIDYFERKGLISTSF